MNLRNAPEDVADLFPTVGKWRREFRWSRGRTDTYQAMFSTDKSGRPLRCKVTIGHRVMRDEAAARWAIEEILKRASRRR